MNNILLLGSQSQSRARLLREAKISFSVVGHRADESACDWAGLTFPQIVSKIALTKMKHVNLPEKAQGGDVCFLLTADTLGMTKGGEILGKPTDRADAIEKIKAARNGERACTAFCLDKRVYKFDEWKVAKRIEIVVESEYIFSVPDEWIDRYLEHSLGFQGSAAVAIEAFGDQFLKEVRGSYSAIVGLPMFELRCALDDVGFF